MSNTPPAAVSISPAALVVPQRGFYRHYVLALLTGIYAVNVIDRFVVSIVTEQLKSVFQVSDAWMGILSGVGFALVYAILGIPIAYVADRKNRRNIVAGSLALFSAATLACGVAVRFSQLLVARLVVGIGEAGTSPPSHSMISDLYGPKSRATALGIFSMGPNIGMLTAFMFGGWITGMFGWRATFLTAGVPGIVLTLLLLFTVKEPIRGLHDLGYSQSAVAPTVAEVFRFLARRRSFVHLTLASALWSFVGYGTTQWAAPLLIRAHGLDVKAVGTIVGLFLGVGGGVGALLGGLLGSHFWRSAPALLHVGADDCIARCGTFLTRILSDPLDAARDCVLRHSKHDDDVLLRQLPRCHAKPGSGTHARDDLGDLPVRGDHHRARIRAHHRWPAQRFLPAGLDRYRIDRP